MILSHKINKNYLIGPMSYEDRPLNLGQLKSLIKLGVTEIPFDYQNERAVLMIGDTGVGKSTIINFLSGDQLIIKYDGLRPTLDALGPGHAKIGHEKYSETSVPTKVVIDKMAFYDCPGFKDNKSQEQDIANSFYVQRLLDMYSKVKIVLVVDESHISEARADKLPKLLRNLLQAFRTFEDVKDGLCMVINRAGRDNTEDDYHEQILKMAELQNENGHLFEDEERKLLRFLVMESRVLLFKQAPKHGMSKSFIAEASENRIMQCINEIAYVKSRHIQNIISQNAKLAIRDFIDQITQKSNRKVEIICNDIVRKYKSKSQALGKSINGIMGLKADVIRLAEEIKNAQKQNIINLLQEEVPKSRIQDFQEDFASIMFFKGIYDKTSTYFSNLVNKIYSELSHLLTVLDQKITIIQKEEEEEQRRQQALLEARMREEKAKQQQLEREKREQERIERQRQERIKREQERKEKQRLERIRREEERIERQRQLKIRQQQERAKREQERLERQRQEELRRQQQRQQQIRREQERLERERQEKARREQQRLDRERMEAERIAREKKQRERELWNNSKMQIMGELKKTLDGLNNVEVQLQKIKSEALSLQKFNKEIESDFVRIEKTYFSNSRVLQ